MTRISLQCFAEDSPGSKWSGLFHAKWPYYEEWYLRSGGSKKGYLTSSSILHNYMPELFPVYEKLLSLTNGSDAVSRFLTLYCPPAFMRGCSQVVLQKNESTTLIRNYEYIPRYFEGTLLKTNWIQPVIGISDCLWGLLDGINAKGLVASLAFGGDNKVAEGFGIPLIVRYVLEMAANVQEAIAIIKRVPSHMAYNIILCDAAGNAATVFLKPGGEVVVTDDIVCTNHQDTVHWEKYHQASKSAERKFFLQEMLKQPNVSEQQIVHAMFQPPLYFLNQNQNWSTLYTAAYNCNTKELVMLWSFAKLKQSFAQFNETIFQIDLQQIPATI